MVFACPGCGDVVFIGTFKFIHDGDSQTSFLDCLQKGKTPLIMKCGVCGASLFEHAFGRGFESNWIPESDLLLQ